MNTESLDGTLLLKWHLYNLNKSWLGEISLHSVRNHPRAVYEAAVDSDGQRNGPRRLSGRTSSRWQFNTKSKIRISHCAIHQSGQLWFELQRFGAIGRGDVRLFSSLMFVEVEQNKRSARFQKKKKERSESSTASSRSRKHGPVAQTLLWGVQAGAIFSLPNETPHRRKQTHEREAHACDRVRCKQVS